MFSSQGSVREVLQSKAVVVVLPLMFASALALSACGGGEGSTAPPAAVAVEPLERDAIEQAKALGSNPQLGLDQKCTFLRNLPGWLQERVEKFLGVTRAQCGIGAPPSPSPTPSPSSSPSPTTAPPTSGQGAKVQLPIEVIGASGYTENIRFDLADASGVNYLYLQIHRPAYRDASVNKSRQAKASIRVNNNAWIDIADSTPGIVLFAPERSYGGIAGGNYTVRLMIPVNNFRSGENSLDFRFNGTDGFTSGYRVLALNVRKGLEGQNILPAALFVQANPAQWQPQAVSNDLAADIVQGKLLWEGSVALKESPLSERRLKAACASCHAADGRDLKYFNYSDWSIVERSKFHGLSETGGKQIAAYIRNLSIPTIPQARPWNPPYQPGPGLDGRPVEQWAAGAGLAAVLSKDQDMLPYLFPNMAGSGGDFSDANLSSTVSARNTLNIREIPVALQFPDWNAWLPEVHPVDIWGDRFGSGPQNAYETARNVFATNRLGSLVAQKRVVPTFNAINASVREFVSKGSTEGVPSDPNGGSPWRTGKGENIDAAVNGYPRELIKLSIAQWSAVKQWELAQSFGLEATAPAVLAAGGEARAWPSNGQSMHPLAPHITADNINGGFAWQSLLAGKYFSTVWYQVQMTVNSGQRQLVNVEPQDWPYQFKHIHDLSRVSGIQHPGRLIQSLIKAYQNRDNGAGPNVNGWQLRITHPLHLHSSPETGSTQIWDALDTYEVQLGESAGMLKRRIRSALAREAFRVTSNFALSDQRDRKIGQWAVCSTDTPRAPESWYCLQRQDYAVSLPGNNRSYEWPQNIHANNFASVLRYFKQDDLVDASVRADYVTWLKQVWPGFNWEQYK